MRKYFNSFIILNLILFFFPAINFSSEQYPVVPKQPDKSKNVSTVSSYKTKGLYGKPQVAPKQPDKSKDVSTVLSEETKGLHGKPQGLKGTLKIKPSSKAAKAAVKGETPEQENLFRQSLTALYRKDFAKAEKKLMELIETQKDSPKYHYYLGYVLYSQKRMAEAIKEFQISYSLDPEFSRSLPANLPAK